MANPKEISGRSSSARLDKKRFRSYETHLQSVIEMGDQIGLLGHDLRSFLGEVLNPDFFGGKKLGIRRLLNRSRDDILKILEVTDEQIGASLEEVPQITISGREEVRKQERKRKASAIFPHLGEILPALRDSMGFIHATGSGNRPEQEKWLDRLLSRQLALKPLMDFYGIDLNRGITEETRVDGALFISLFNLAKNAMTHGVHLVDSHGGKTYGSIRHRSWDDSLIIQKLSTRPVTNNFLEFARFNKSHFGIAIGGMYASLLGKSLKTKSKPTQTPLNADPDRIVPERQLFQVKIKIS